MLIKTLAADDKHPVLKRENLTIGIHMDLSDKQKHFSHFSPAFLKCLLNFEHFEIKDNPHIFCISEITDSESMIR